jgi:hypothetical protein
MGWSALGVELNREVVMLMEERVGVPVHTPDAALPRRQTSSRYGDMIEHLTDLDQRLIGVIRILRTSGDLIAQGPLENNWKS